MNFLIFHDSTDYKSTYSFFIYTENYIDEVEKSKYYIYLPFTFSQLH